MVVPQNYLRFLGGFMFIFTNCKTLNEIGLPPKLTYPLSGGAFGSMIFLFSPGVATLKTANDQQLCHCISHQPPHALESQEWLDASLFDVVRANQKGLHLSMVRILLRQLLEQLKVLQVGQGCLMLPVSLGILLILNNSETQDVPGCGIHSYNLSL